MIGLKKHDFVFLQIFLEEKTGINITPDKAFIVEARLLPLLRKYVFSDFSDLISALRFGKPEIIEDVINNVTTNETFFFRDFAPIEKLLKNKFTDKNQKISILSAACSAGQEAYSLAMMLLENGYSNFEIDGIDVSSQVIKKAKLGIYNNFEVQRGMPINYLLKYFSKQNDGNWQVKDKLKSLCTFKGGNILSFPESDSKKYTLVICRNLMIYFSPEKRLDLCKSLSSYLKESSYLVIGLGEGFTLDQKESCLSLGKVEGFTTIYRLNNV